MPEHHSLSRPGVGCGVGLGPLGVVGSEQSLHAPSLVLSSQLSLCLNKCVLCLTRFTDCSPGDAPTDIKTYSGPGDTLLG